MCPRAVRGLSRRCQVWPGVLRAIEAASGAEGEARRCSTDDDARSRVMAKRMFGLVAAMARSAMPTCGAFIEPTRLQVTPPSVDL